MMRIYIPTFGRPIVFALAMLLVGGCAQGVAAVSYGIQTDAEFNEIVIADVRLAQRLAELGNDPIALKCWTYIEEFAVANAPEGKAEDADAEGVLSKYQKARNLRRNVVEVEITDAFRIECGPMLIESMGVLGRLGVRIAL